MSGHVLSALSLDTEVGAIALPNDIRLGLRSGQGFTNHVARI